MANHSIALSVQGLHSMLRVLPVALPLAMGHEAVDAAVKLLGSKLSAKDALRVHKLYELVAKNDSTTESLDPLLEPLFAGVQ